MTQSFPPVALRCLRYALCGSIIRSTRRPCQQTIDPRSRSRDCVSIACLDTCLTIGRPLASSVGLQHDAKVVRPSQAGTRFRPDRGSDERSIAQRRIASTNLRRPLPGHAPSTQPHFVGLAAFNTSSCAKLRPGAVACLRTRTEESADLGDASSCEESGAGSASLDREERFAQNCAAISDAKIGLDRVSGPRHR
jgi:hypothetical protein